MSSNLFDDDLEPEDDGFAQDGPGLFDEPVVQGGPDLFAEPAPAPEAGPSLPAPESRKRERVVDNAPAAPLALYRRYRPDTFSDVIGQEHVTDPLQRALVNNRVNHAYLFSGPRGCGKTTSARILARCLNCEQGPTPTPCGQCQSCRDLARGGGGSIDVIEIDAASHGGVDDARDLREKAFFAPVHSRYKIYIIDEAHMVTAAGFNALLKLVEEPPPHVKFIFATTEPEKVIGTIRSRTHHYPFRLVPPKVLQQYLGDLCEREGVAVEPTVLPLVVRAGAGSVRDSLSVLDQLLGGAQADGVSYEHASRLLGYTPDSLLDRILDAFAAGDSSEVFATIDAVIEQGQDPRRFAEDLLRRLRDLVVVAAVDDAITSGLVDVSGDQAERLQNQAAALGLGELTRAAEVISAGLTEMRGTTAPRLHLELMCARVLLPGADVDERGIHARLDRLERRLGMGDPNAAPPMPAQAWDLGNPVAEGEASRPVPSRPAVAPSPAPARPEAREPVPAQAPPADVVDAVAARPSGVEEAPTTPAEAAAHPTNAEALAPSAPRADVPAAPPASPAPAGGGAFGIADLRRLWPTVLDAVRERRRFTWIVLSQQAHVVDVNGNTLALGFANGGAKESFERGGSVDVLTDVLIEVTGIAFKVETIIDAGDAPQQAPQSAPAMPEPPRPAPVPTQALAAAREQIRPTQLRRDQPDDEPEPEPEYSRDDPDLDVAPVSSDALLKDVLGAEHIADEDA